jgi:glycosyltransferase involved in cell wall biosynthesis
MASLPCGQPPLYQILFEIQAGDGEVMINLVWITNVPPPYRVPVFNLIAQDRRFSLTVIFCAERYPESTWDYGEIECPHVFLRECFYRKPGEIIHNNPDVLCHLRRINPDVVITSGFNPTMLYAYGYAQLYRKKHIPLSDGTLISESHLSLVHRIIRRVVFTGSCAFIGASDMTRVLYESYGVTRHRYFKSPLCVDNARFADVRSQLKRYDVIFSARFIELKNPLFVIELAAALRDPLQREISLLFVGKGPLEDAMRKRLQELQYKNFMFQGYVSQRELPDLYASSRVLLFPSANDAWGVVVNEACAAGLPVITTPYAGVAGELVRDSENGYICELNISAWTDRLQRLLTDEALCQSFSRKSVELVKKYNYEVAAEGVIEAVLFATNRP